MRWLLLAAVCVWRAEAQFGEIASLATSLLGGGLGSALGNAGSLGASAGSAAGAAAGAGGALAQLGQLYQLAQGALQLTGTGVGVLNQASEGNWFPAVLEQTAKSSHGLMGGGSPLSLGALGGGASKPTATGIGPEFGTSFPAPDTDDYNENTQLPGAETEKKVPTAPDGLVDIDSGDYEVDSSRSTSSTSTASATTPPAPVTLFPDVEETTTGSTPTSTLPRQIRIQLPHKELTVIDTDHDYEELVKSKDKTPKSIIENRIDLAESVDEIKRNVVATHAAKTKPVPNLGRLVEVLKKSKLSNEEIKEIVSQVEGNGRIELPPKIDFSSAVQNIPEKRRVIREKIVVASRTINQNFQNQHQTQNKDQRELSVAPNVEYSRPSASTTQQIPVASTTPATPPPTPSQITANPSPAPGPQQAYLAQVQHQPSHVLQQSYYPLLPTYQQQQAQLFNHWTHPHPLFQAHHLQPQPPVQTTQGGQPAQIPQAQQQYYQYYPTYNGYPYQQAYQYYQYPYVQSQQQPQPQQQQIQQGQQQQQQFQQYQTQQPRGQGQYPEKQPAAHTQGVQVRSQQQVAAARYTPTQTQVRAAGIRAVSGDSAQRPGFGHQLQGQPTPFRAAQHATPTAKAVVQPPQASAQFRSWTETISRTTQRPDPKLYPTRRARFVATPTPNRHSN